MRRWRKGFGEDDPKTDTVHDMSTVQAEVKRQTYFNERKSQLSNHHLASEMFPLQKNGLDSKKPSCIHHGHTGLPDFCNNTRAIPAV